MLRLTKKADYGLIALKHLASRHHDPGVGTVSAKEVADSYGIPLPLLSKILQKLTKTGLLVSEHGTNGACDVDRGGLDDVRAALANLGDAMELRRIVRCDWNEKRRLGGRRRRRGGRLGGALLHLHRERRRQ